MTRNRLTDYGDAIDTKHPYCCQLKAAAEADLEVAWEMREANRMVLEMIEKRTAALVTRERHAKEWARDGNCAALVACFAASAAIVFAASGYAAFAATVMFWRYII